MLQSHSEGGGRAIRYRTDHYPQVREWYGRQFVAVNILVTKRFDRDGERKLYTQTLAAINPEAESYGQLIDTCRKLHLPESDCQEVFRRMVFNILANNTDDHNKNFSFIMNEDGSWRLSPAYDITYIIDNGGFLPNEDHCLYIRTKLRNITRDDAIQFARDNGISKQRTHSARQWMIGTAIVTSSSELSGVYVRLCYELADSLNSFGRIKVSPYLCFANSKNKYDETDKKDVAAIGPADSGWNNGTDACE